MHRQICTASGVRNSLISSNNQCHIWISDNILAETYNDFTRRHRRYGSNVPGPLEARRRAAKRKNTSLAHINFNDSSLDQAFVFGVGSQKSWWQKHKAVAAEPTSRLLPAWFAQPSKDLYGPSLNLDDIHASGMTAGVEKEFKSRLKKCSDVDSIRGLANSMGLSLRKQPDLARAAFFQLLNIYWNRNADLGSNLSDFLCDPSLNPSGAGNFLNLIRQLCHKKLSKAEWQTNIEPAMLNAIQLGLIDIKELEEIILTMPTVFSNADWSQEADDVTPVDSWYRMMEALQACQVLSVADFGNPFISQWLGMLSQCSPSEHLAQLIMQLQPVKDLNEIDVFVELLIYQVKRSASDAVSSPGQIIGWINHLHDHQRVQVTFQASLKLITDACSSQTSSLELECWHNVLAVFSTKELDLSTIDWQTWDDKMNRTTSLSKQQYLLALAWTISNMFSKVQSASQALSKLKLPTRLQAVFGNGNLKMTEIISQLVCTLDTLPLPGKGRLFSVFAIPQEHGSMSIFDRAVHETSLRAISNRDLRLFSDESLYRWAEQNSPEELARFAESVNDKLAVLRDIGPSLILKNKTTMKIIRRVLKHNLPLKLSVGQWPRTVSYHKQINHRQYDIDPATVVDLVHHLAIAAAVSPVIGARSAFRNVYFYYLWLHRYGAPIKSEMSRALWHAGVTRYGKDGTSQAQLKWCLGKVREIEGPKIASLLMWSAGYRAHRATDIEAVNLPKLLSRRRKSIVPVNFEVGQLKRNENDAQTVSFKPMHFTELVTYANDAQLPNSLEDIEKL